MNLIGALRTRRVRVEPIGEVGERVLRELCPMPSCRRCGSPSHLLVQHGGGLRPRTACTACYRATTGPIDQTTNTGGQHGPQQ
mgnify:CR=1 FL=1